MEIFMLEGVPVSWGMSSQMKKCCLSSPIFPLLFYHGATEFAMVNISHFSRLIEKLSELF